MLEEPKIFLQIRTMALYEKKKKRQPRREEEGPLEAMPRTHAKNSAPNLVGERYVTQAKNVPKTRGKD